jgi:hypothetical protein
MIPEEKYDLIYDLNSNFVEEVDQSLIEYKNLLVDHFLPCFALRSYQEPHSFVMLQIHL